MPAAFSEISASQLMRLVGTPESPVLIDVISDEDFALGPCPIPSALRYPQDQMTEVLADLQGKRVVVIRAADTNSRERSPQAVGLLAISVGLSRQYIDDTEQLEAALPLHDALYDALYRWIGVGFSEGHDWPAAVTQ